MEFKTSEFEFSKENYGVMLIIDDFNDDIIRYKPLEESKDDEEAALSDDQIKYNLLVKLSKLKHIKF